MPNDPYAVLGLPHTATEEEVTKAYRALAKKYHPDLNPGDETAAQKMSAINAAYDMIKDGWTPESAQRTAQTGSAGAYGTAGTYGQGTNPFGGEGFDPFAEFFRRYAYGQQNAGRAYGGTEDDLLNSARIYINNRRFSEALNVLGRVSVRTARWYYLSAVANYGAGNAVTALEHARTAARLEPDNTEYRRLFERLTEMGVSYGEESRSYGRPVTSFPRFCLRLILANLILNAVLGLCCYNGNGGGGFCF